MAEVVTFQKRKPCPICGKPSEPKQHPFCSARCRDIDLSRWLGGKYAIPTHEQEADSSAERED